jgi:hypothetical protein
MKEGTTVPALEKQKFYIIGHNPNTLEHARGYLEAGANALEPDVCFSAKSSHPDHYYVSHDHDWVKHGHPITKHPEQKKAAPRLTACAGNSTPTRAKANGACWGANTIHLTFLES